MLSIHPIPAFNDNYLWLIRYQNNAVVVDPGDAEAVENYLQSHQLCLTAILITHHHHDHTGGVKQLKATHHCRVYGPDSAKISDIDVLCQPSSTCNPDGLPISFNVIDVPGHTLDHIAYFASQSDLLDNTLFCGDTLFSAGCGRLFEGTPQQMWYSIQKLMALPDSTQIYPAHEYTTANLKFAAAVEPDNSKISDYRCIVDKLRADNKPSLPTILKLEKQVNPFMRVEEPSVIQAAKNRLGKMSVETVEVFAEIRHWKDSF